MFKIPFIIGLKLFRRKWRILNKNNFTYPMNLFPLKIVTCGNFSYGPLEIYTWLRDKEVLRIGNFVSISRGVKFILGGNHHMENISNYHFKTMILNGEEESWTKGPIVVEDDVWIGTDSLILSGVTLGKGAVIGAGSVVTKDIPPYAVAAGNPAAVVRYRFQEDVIKLLEDINYFKVDNKFIIKNSSLFYNGATENAIKQLIDAINKSGD